nr:polysaccharide biosynthesis/export family protein [Ruegeria arenilitoris]
MWRAPPRVKAPPFHLGTGDVVASIRPARVAELAGSGAQRDTFTVRDDGTISIPGAGRVQVAGRTISEAETDVFDALARGQRNPAVLLEVVAYNSKHVAVGGQVATSVVVPLTVAPLTPGQAIAAAGGLTTRDRELGTIRIYRSWDLYQIPLRDNLARPEFRQLVLLNGDAVFSDTSYDLDRALKFYRDQIEVICLNLQAKGAALAELEQEVGLRGAELTETLGNITVRSQLGAEQRGIVDRGPYGTAALRYCFHPGAAHHDLGSGAGSIPTLAGQCGVGRGKWLTRPALHRI